MASKQLGNLLRSVPAATASPEASPIEAPPEVVAAPPAPVPPEKPERAPRTVARVEPEVPLQVLIPANIRKQLALLAAEEGESLRALTLRAIRSLGITVTDADIKGKRGRKNS
jgi:hypothetical protein